MYTATDNYTDSSTISSAGFVREQTRWEAFKTVSEASKEMGGDITADFHDAPSDENESGTEDRKNRIQYELWDKLQEMYALPLGSGTIFGYFSEGMVSVGSFDFDLCNEEQMDPEEWEDTAAVASKRIGIRKVRIIERSKIRPVVFEGEFQAERDAWVDTAAVSPKRKGLRIVRIKRRKKLKSFTLPGEFAEEDQR